MYLYSFYGFCFQQVRGDPDGCGLEVSPPYTVNPDLQRVDLPAEDLLYIKKGWLMKQSLNHVSISHLLITHM